jgi:hypothetical protein
MIGPGVSHQISVFSSSGVHPGMAGGGKVHVSTNPALDPLAAESFRPCGKAR